MSKNDNVINLKKYEKKPRLNLGVYLFGLMFIYLIVNILLFFTKDHVSVYEVRQGSILKDNAFTGVALRNEEILYSSEDGYINFFKGDGAKLAYGKNVYTLSGEPIKDAQAEETNDEVDMSTEDWNSILMRTQTFNENFKASDFKTVYTLKENTNGIVDQNTTKNRATQLETLLSEQTDNQYHVFTAEKDGIITYVTDGYEGKNYLDLEKADFDKQGYRSKEITNNMFLSAGDPAYKLVTSEDWTLSVILTPGLKDYYTEKMQDKDRVPVKVRFSKDNEVVVGSLEIEDAGGDVYYGHIHFSNSMIRYVQDRFLDIEIIMDDETGLKIPKSSVVEKEYYIIPDEFLALGGGANDWGVLLKDQDDITFVSAKNFSRNAEGTEAYISSDILSRGDVLVKTDTGEEFTVNDSKITKGVYNVNKGYAVFKEVDILAESDEYYIVSKGSERGLSNYDYIALDGSRVHENDVISQ